MYKQAILFFFLVSISFSTISSLDISGTIYQSGSVEMTMKAELSEPGERQLCISLLQPVETVVVKDRSGLVINHTLEVEANLTKICSTVPYDYLQLEVISNSFTSKEGSLWDFDFDLTASEDITSFVASLELPKGTLLKSTNGAVEGTSDSLSISWNAEGVDTQHKVNLRAGYEINLVDELDLNLVIALIFFIILAVIYFFSRKQPEKTEKKIESIENNDVFKTLDETDKEIVLEIYKKGKTTQSHLYLHTHLPKATLSRRLASLENKEIIKKSKKGNRNLVTLTDVLKK